ncbi:MAG: hypothetical protein ACI4P8_04415 [Akkermansia sp.]
MMKRLVAKLMLMGMCSVLTPPAAALPPTMSEAFEAYIALPDALAPILNSVQDRETADAAAAPLHQQLSDIHRAGEQLQRIGELSAEEKREIEQRYAQRMREQWARIYAEIFRLQKVQCYSSPTFIKEFGIMTMMLSQ